MVVLVDWLLVILFSDKIPDGVPASDLTTVVINLNFGSHDHAASREAIDLLFFFIVSKIHATIVKHLIADHV